MEGFAAWRHLTKNINVEETDWTLPSDSTIHGEEKLPPDLILFGEFSELKGPMPLLTIPSLSTYRTTYTNKADKQQLSINCSQYVLQKDVLYESNVQDQEICNNPAERNGLCSKSNLNICSCNNCHDQINLSCCDLGIVSSSKDQIKPMSEDENYNLSENTGISLPSRVPHRLNTSHLHPEISCSSSYQALASHKSINISNIPDRTESSEEHYAVNQTSLVNNSTHDSKRHNIQSSVRAPEQPSTCPPVSCTPTPHCCLDPSTPQSPHGSQQTCYKHVLEGLTFQADPYYHDISLNNLILRLMSTDYQSFGGLFRVSCDSEVIEEDLLGEFSGLSAVVRYITLHDIRARGFVRPLCISYLTWDRRKLDTCLHHIRQKMKEASAYLKSSNMCLFGWEVLERLTDLQYTKERYIDALRRSETISSVSDTRNSARATATTKPATPTPATIPTSTHATIPTSTPAATTPTPTPATPTPGHLYAGDEDLLRHTSLESVASQLRDCRRILSLITQHLSSIPELGELQQLCSLVLGQTNSPLEEAMRNRGLLQCFYSSIPSDISHISGCVEKTVSSDDQFNADSGLQNPIACSSNVDPSISEVVTIFCDDHRTANTVKSSQVSENKPKLYFPHLNLRRSQRLRCLREISGCGFVACIFELSCLYKHSSKSRLSLMFEIHDNTCYENDAGTLFIGNLPVVNVVQYSDKYDDTRAASGVTSKTRNESSSHKTFKRSICDDTILVDLVREEWTNDTNDLFVKAVADDGWISATGSPQVLATQWSAVSAQKCESDLACSDVTGLFDETAELIAKNYAASKLTANSTLVAHGLNRNSFTRDSHVGCSQSAVSTGSASSASCTAKRVPASSANSASRSSLARKKKYRQHPRVDVHMRMYNAYKRELSSLLLSSPVTPSLVASLLCGRRLVVAGRMDKRLLVEATVMAFAATLLPVAQDNLHPLTRYHRGTITQYHLNDQPLLGLCIPVRLTIDDLMNVHTKSKISLVNLSTGHISGAPYCGKLVQGLEQFHRLYKVKDQIGPKNEAPSPRTSAKNASSPDSSVPRRNSCVNNKLGTGILGLASRSSSSPNVAGRFAGATVCLNASDSSHVGEFCVNPSARFSSSNLDTSHSHSIDQIDVNMMNLVSNSSNSSLTNSSSLLSTCNDSPTTADESSSSIYDMTSPNRDVPLQAFIQSMLVRLGLQVYLYFHVCGNCTIEPAKLMSIINVEERVDGQILEYLSSIVSRQLDLAEVPVDYLP